MVAVDRCHYPSQQLFYHAESKTDCREVCDSHCWRKLNRSRATAATLVIELWTIKAESAGFLCVATPMRPARGPTADQATRRRLK